MTSLASGYLWSLNVAIVVVAVAIVVSGLDDLFMDICYWGRALWRVLLGRAPRQVTLGDLRSREQRPIAIMVPAWHEADVIGSMAENTLSTLDYQSYVAFLGVYRNDPATCERAEALRDADPERIVVAPVDRDGPTCKADCLNWILKAITEYERKTGVEFAGMVMHDCEDVVHPLELLYCNSRLDDADLLQLPVMSLEVPWNAWVGGTYLDDFSELHQKDLPVRQWLTGSVPGAGVALCYSRRAILALAQRYQGQPFNTDSLTEDYDFSFRLAQFPEFRQVFVPERVQRPEAMALDLWRRPATATGLLATCEFFPSTFRAAYRQRARWTLGIAFLGWRQLGWPGRFRDRYMLLRDRKGIVTAPLSMLAYVVLLNLAVLELARRAGADVPDPQALVLHRAWLAPILVCNLALLANRLGQRAFFVGRVHGLQQALMSVPRTVVSNFVNFAAVSRAWSQWLGHLSSGAPIAWDKTQHTFPSTAELAQHRRRLGDLLVSRGAITPQALDAALSQQRRSGSRLGRVLVEQGSVSPEVLADTVAAQQQLPRAGPGLKPASSVSGAIPAALIRDYGVVPVSVGADNLLQVAVTGRPSSEVTKAIRAASGYHVAYVVACDHQVDQWVLELAPSKPEGETEQ